MAKTINFCGDSYCASNTEKSWITILSNLLGYKTIGRGKNGSAHEHAIQSFNPKADITVFCWTEPHRIYHPTYSLNSTTARRNKNGNKVYAAAHAYYHFVHDWQHNKLRQMRELYWFDHEVLSKYSGKVVHCWGFENTYDWKHGTVYDDVFCEWSDPQGDGKRINHFTIEENKLLANNLYKLLRNENG
jgi:hypothetical protein